MSKTFISDLKENDSVISFFGVFNKTIRKTKDEKLYLDLMLVDRTGKINAKIWDDTEKLASQFEKGDAVKVQGVVTSFNNELQIKVEKIRQVIPERDRSEGYDIIDLLLSTTKDIDKMWEDLLELIQSLKNPFLKQVVLAIYEKYGDQIRTHPGSMILHHAFRGGLLEHLHTMCRMAEGVCRAYPELDRDLVISGIMLHDIGKLQELAAGMTITYSDTGNFIGHLVLGRDVVHEECLTIAEFPELLRLKLEHILLSHQGKYEFQSPREPQFLEAMVVYYIDELDTRLKHMKNDIEADLSEGKWTAKGGYFKRVLFKGEPEPGEK
ncbi:MAG: HD domain-containing protein [Candidatus Neomarinimicrobiota bacterium]